MQQMIKSLNAAKYNIHAERIMEAEIDLRVALKHANAAKAKRQAGYIICAITALKRKFAAEIRQ